MSAIAPIRPFDLSDLAADTQRIKRLSELYDRCLMARNALRMVEERYRRSLATLAAAYDQAARELADELATSGEALS